jgi:rhamnose utilization protein RhaD (predicted bifunctional aldolase and dehydrogenase)
MNSTTNTLQASVINYCSTIGRDPLLVQGAGGNVSWKEGNTLWIKASGTWLADAGSNK